MATVAEQPKVKEKHVRERLTDKRLKALAVKSGTRAEIADNIVRGLRIRAGKSGKKGWSMLYAAYLRCRKPFESEGPLNRICFGCERKDVSPCAD